MSISQFPVIAGGSSGKPLRCAPDVYPIHQELVKAGSRGSHWARQVTKELEAVSAGRLSRYGSRCQLLTGGTRRHVLAFDGVTFVLHGHSKGLYVLTGVEFQSGGTLDAARKTLRTHASVDVAPPTATTLSSKGEAFLKSIEVL